MLLIVIAVLPPIIILSILKFSTESSIEIEQREKVEQSVEKAEAFILSEQGRVRYNVQELSKDSVFLKILRSKKKNLEKRSEIFDKYRFRFLHITDSDGNSLYSFGKLVESKNRIVDIKNLQNRNLLTKETDLQGDHAALTYVVPIDSTFYLYAGQYVDYSLVYLIENISDASVTIQFDSLENLKQEELIDDSFETVLLSSQRDNITIRLHFSTDDSGQFFTTVSEIITIVTICMMVLAILVGLYLTGKTKKEIENLQFAFADVAGGNFDTTVMAYEKNEFSELADSFSEMVLKLKITQTKLSTVEKIAAWETVGRKLAHEIKNPLSPISIAADDLRSSYYEKLPNFDKTLDETTSTIKKEVKRMTLLLDEFVSFARMKQSELQKTNFDTFMQELQELYANDIRNQKLQIKSDIKNIIVQLDNDTFRQLFINLIKNGFESKENAIVSVSIREIGNRLQILISDNGTGFSEAKLKNSFMPFETTKENGSGLGLIICHRIILDHNGTMILQNRKDGGGEVVITLPTV